MAAKPTTADGYPPELATEARRMSLFVATILGDLLDDVVVVGGLCPYLLVDQEDRSRARHVGTQDLDLGLSLAILDHERYREVSRRLRDRGFRPVRKEGGQVVRQTWQLPGERVTIDFLIPPTERQPRAGRLQSLEKDFAAIVAAGLPLAFRDFEEVVIDDVTPVGERARRSVRVCGPAAFVAMKAHAFRLRGENKDAYDLVYVLRNFGARPSVDVAVRFAGISDDAEARSAHVILAEDFATPDHVGPRRHAAFLGTADDANVRADAFGVVAEFLAKVGEG